MILAVLDRVVGKAPHLLVGGGCSNANRIARQLLAVRRLALDDELQRLLLAEAPEAVERAAEQCA